MLTPHCSAASGMVAPPSIVPTTRLRRSAEYGFAIPAGLLPAGSLNHIRAAMGIPDSAFSGNALVDEVRRCIATDLDPAAVESAEMDSRGMVVELAMLVILNSLVAMKLWSRIT